jgi:hypothetical protein
MHLDAIIMGTWETHFEAAIEQVLEMLLDAKPELNSAMHLEAVQLGV